MFARDIHGNGDVNEDILQVLIPPRYVHAPYIVSMADVH